MYIIMAISNTSTTPKITISVVTFPININQNKNRSRYKPSPPLKNSLFIVHPFIAQKSPETNSELNILNIFYLFTVSKIFLAIDAPSKPYSVITAIAGPD